MLNFDAIFFAELVDPLKPFLNAWPELDLLALIAKERTGHLDPAFFAFGNHRMEITKGFLASCLNREIFTFAPELIWS